MNETAVAVDDESKIPTAEIQRSYIISELSKAVSGNYHKLAFVKKLETFTRGLEDSEIKELTRLLSDEYRRNSVYRYTKADLNWIAREVPINKIYLSSTNKSENRILKNLSVPWNLGCLIERIQSGKTEGLEAFLFREVLIDELAIAVSVTDDKVSEIKIIDGMHRSVASLTKSGANTLKIYLGLGER